MVEPFAAHEAPTVPISARLLAAAGGQEVGAVEDAGYVLVPRGLASPGGDWARRNPPQRRRYAAVAGPPPYTEPDLRSTHCGRDAMKAIIRERYGRPDVLELREVDRPVPTDDQVLLRVHASSVNPVEWYDVTGLFAVRLGGGLRRPKDARVGVDVAGRVEAVGRNVQDFRPGDEVFGAASGAWAEYTCASADTLVARPANVSFEEAAAVPVAALTALQGLRDHGRVQSGQKVLINGASGGVGTYAVQLAKAVGAEVTGVCSPRNVEQARSLGADHVVDYTREDFTKLGERFDLMLDIAGSRPFRQYRRVLTPKATIVLIGGPLKYRGLGPLPHLVGSVLSSRFRSQRLTFFVAKNTKDDLAELAGLLAAGTVRSVIDRSFPLSQAAEALAYLGEGHARAKIAITV